MKDAKTTRPQHPTAANLTALITLGVLAALTFLFLWLQLVLARSGGTAFCGLDTAASCTAAWDSPFASQVHQFSGLPLAAWGLVWALAAFGLPLIALLRLAEGRPQPALVAGTRMIAAVGLASVIVMLLASMLLGVFCVGCFAADIMIAGYAGIALFGWTAFGWPQAPRAATLAGLACFAGYLALLYPGIHTPRPTGAAGRAAITNLATQTAGQPSTGTGDAERDAQLVELVKSLEPRLKQTLSDSLAIYRSAPPVTSPDPQPGPRAAVHITEWTDIRCEHCADLQQTLQDLREHTPEGSFSVEARQFPLDGECNSLIQRAEDPVRCLAARARICLASNPKSDEFTRAIFAKQKELTAAQLYQIAGPFMERKALEACVGSAATKTRLEADIAYAQRFDSDGTPIVALNGRKGVSFPPFLYAMVLTGGAPDHPAFANLPPPNPQAHLH